MGLFDFSYLAEMRKAEAEIAKAKALEMMASKEGPLIVNNYFFFKDNKTGEVIKLDPKRYKPLDQNKVLELEEDEVKLLE